MDTRGERGAREHPQGGEAEGEEQHPSGEQGETAAAQELLAQQQDHETEDREGDAVAGCVNEGREIEARARERREGDAHTRTFEAAGGADRDDQQHARREQLVGGYAEQDVSADRGIPQPPLQQPGPRHQASRPDAAHHRLQRDVEDPHRDGAVQAIGQPQRSQTRGLDRVPGVRGAQQRGGEIQQEHGAGDTQRARTVDAARPQIAPGERDPADQDEHLAADHQVGHSDHGSAARILHIPRTGQPHVHETTTVRRHRETQRNVRL
jgi:hypothetical protein